MRNHTVLGARMLSDGDSIFLKMAELIALNHIEKYTAPLSPRHPREDIPLVARICASVMSLTR